MRIGRAIAAAALLFFTAAAAAQDPAPYEYFSALAGPNRPQKSLGTDGIGLTAGALYGRNFGGRWGTELQAFGATFETGDDRGTDFYQKGVLADAVWTLQGRRGREHSSYLIAGLGFAYNDFYPDTRDGWTLLAEVGAGIVSAPMFDRDVHLRVEARYVRDFSEGGHAEPRLALGVEVPLFRPDPPVSKPVVMALPPPPAAPPQIREVVREVPRPWIDSDGDNVDDEHDRCPGTPRGVRADSFGCVIENQRIELPGVTFENNSARLTTGAQLVLDGVAKNLAGWTGLNIEVAGHTDSVGQAATNLQLSAARADSVRRYLVEHGVDGARLTSRGYGEYELLVSPEQSDADRQTNRRVELRLTDAKVAR